MPTGDELESARRLLDIPHCPVSPTQRQAEFLLDVRREALYGGAAGGGKSVALLMAACQFLDVPGYSALLLRPRLGDLTAPGGLLDLAYGWFTNSGARFDRDNSTYLFANGARIVFGHLGSANDHNQFQGAQFQFIGFDELTQFSEHHYLYLHSRLRRPTGVLEQVPLRMRATANPGGTGHAWVRARFVTPWQRHHHNGGPPPERAFHPAKLDDNPHLDAGTYRESLGALDAVTRRQLLHGDWDITYHGGLFHADWFPTDSTTVLGDRGRRVRFWDLAATTPGPGRDPDYTVGALLTRNPDTKIIHIIDIVRRRGSPHEIEQLIANTAHADGRSVTIGIEQEPAAAGIALMDHYRRNVLEGYTVKALRPTGNKTTRAQPLASAAEAGYIRLIDAAWNDPFIEEAVLFPQGPHDDQIDAVVGAHQLLTTTRGTGDVPAPISITRDDCEPPDPHKFE